MPIIMAATMSTTAINHGNNTNYTTHGSDNHFCNTLQQQQEEVFREMVNKQVKVAEGTGVRRRKHHHQVDGSLCHR